MSTNADSTLGFRVVDADSHVYEPTRLWDDYVPAPQRDLARSAFHHQIDAKGNATTILNGAPAKELNRSKVIRQAIWRPGETAESIGGLDPAVFHSLNPGAWDAGARLADMDRLGIDEAIVYPTLFLEYFPLVQDPAAASVLATAYNEWIWDLCSEGDGRLHPVALLPQQDVAAAVHELDRVARRGFKAAVLRPVFLSKPSDQPVHDDPIMAMMMRSSRYLIDAEYESLWRGIEESGLVACIHPSVGITNADGTSEGTFIERVAEQMGIGHSVAETVAFDQDNAVFLTAVCYHGLMEDFPKLRLALVHSGASMLPLTLEKSETYLWVSFGSMFGSGNPVSLEPRDVFERLAALVTFDSWETAVGVGADPMFESKAAWGSRYPHHDATGPADAVEMLRTGGASPEAIKQLMGSNCAALFGLQARATSSAAR